MLLQLGDKGDNVKYLQYGLHILCCSPNGFDGEFGNGTLTAVKKFQSKYGLVSDGIVGDVTWNTLKNEIATIQAQLNKKGCSVGTVDGIAGPATYNAVISFQNKNGLTADGQVGPATWDVLFDTISGGNSYSRILKLTSPLMYGEDIRAVQNKLNSLGYNAGTADGYYGNATRSAVISFQSAKGLTADGEVGPATWNALFNSYSSSGSGTLPGGSIKVFIDAGHGGYDGGTVAKDGTTEKDLTLALALETGKQLKKLNPEIKVVYTRTSDKVTWSEDETEDLKARVKMAKKEKADYFFSFHINSNEDPTCSGYVSYIRQDDKASEQITEYICKNLSGLDWTHDRGTLTTEFYPLHVVDEQKIPAILFEAGFSTNTKEIQKLKNPTNQKKVAKAIAKAFNKYITENK